MAKIYISSTYSDLQAYRRVVYDALRKIGHDVIAMEDYVATDARPLDKCLADVAAADVYLGIYAWRYGYIPTTDNPEGKSITECEFRHAVRLGKPCLLFLLDEQALWPRAAMEKGLGAERIETFRTELATAYTVSFFHNDGDLATLAVAAVHNWAETQGRQVEARRAALPTRRHFVSYSASDAREFVGELAHALEAGAPPLPVWLDQLDLHPAQSRDEQVFDAIRDCDSLVFILSQDGVMPGASCEREWTRALTYKKPIVPVKFHADAALPYRLRNRQPLDLTDDGAAAVARLHDHLEALSTPAGRLRLLEELLADARGDLAAATTPEQQRRIQTDIDALQPQVAAQQRVVEDPRAAVARTEESIARGLERERQPETPKTGVSHTKFINPPPAVAPGYFQDRHVETGLVGKFLQNDAQRVMTIVGRGGIGKTVLVCRLLKALEAGHLPDDAPPLSVDGIVYLSALGSRGLNVPHLYADLSRLLSDDVAAQLDALYKDPQASTEHKLQALLAAFPSGCIILLLDNFESVIDLATLSLTDNELDQALRSVLNAPQHAVKALITTRVAPRELLLVQPQRQAHLNLNEGLPSPFAENILREMDADGTLGLQTADASLLTEARLRTRGNPRALEVLYASLAADRATSLPELLEATATLLPENVVEVLVGEAFSRLDVAAQQVMQALAVYSRPVPPTAVDYLLQPYVPSINSTPILSRLVNMQFVRKEAGRYYLHPVDREYALGRIPAGAEADRDVAPAPFTRSALLHRAADYFTQTRLPRETWKTLDDLDSQLAEFELRCAGGEYDVAAQVVWEIDFNYLQLWGYYWLLIGLRERLEGKLSDAYAKGENATGLGLVYSSIGRYREAINRYEEALAIFRELGDRQGEGAVLGNLGNADYVLGQTAEALDAYQQALTIAREIGDRRNEGTLLGNLGNAYAALGQTAEALDAYQQALTIAREIGDLPGEARHLSNIAEVLIDVGRCDEAVQRAQESVHIAEDVGSPSQANYSNSYLALAYLTVGNLPAACAAAEAARQYDEPQNNHYVLALLGVITLCQGERSVARETFTTALAEVETLLSHTGQNYGALDSKGLALCGLTLCDDGDHLAYAAESYAAARRINRDAGVVARVLRLFDALAQADTVARLAEVREAAGRVGP